MNIFEEGIRVWISELSAKDRVLLEEVLSKEEFIQYARLALSEL